MKYDLVICRPKAVDYPNDKTKSTEMIVLLSVFSVLLLVIVIGRINLSIQFRSQVKELLSQSGGNSLKTYSNEQLNGQPEPVKRYFLHVLKEGQPYISTVRFVHSGFFKAGKNKKWMKIKGEQYVTTQTPGFIWKGMTTIFTARDMYLSDAGRLTVSLFSFFKILDAKGKNYDQGELLRWLGESVFYPTNLLPSERLEWTSINEYSAQLTFHYKRFSLPFQVTFNAEHEISQLETKRYMDKQNLETWIIKLADYKQMQGILVPTNTEVLWRLKEGDLSYAKFLIEKIEYNFVDPFRR